MYSLAAGYKCSLGGVVLTVAANIVLTQDHNNY